MAPPRGESVVHCHFDLYSSQDVQIDSVGEDFRDLREAQEMAKAVLLDFAQNRFKREEDCVVVCKMRAGDPERYFLASLTLREVGADAAGALPRPSRASAAAGAASEGGEVSYRMSADWTDLRELRTSGFLKPLRTPDRSWFMTFIPSDERARVAAAIDRAIQLRTPFNLEHKVIRADDSVGWTLSHALPILDEQGRVSEWLGVARDVTATRGARAQGAEPAPGA